MRESLNNKAINNKVIELLKNKINHNITYFQKEKKSEEKNS